MMSQRGMRLEIGARMIKTQKMEKEISGLFFTQKTARKRRDRTASTDRNVETRKRD